MKYRIRDCILSEILGKDYYLPEDRNYAVDIEGGWHVHMENAQASKLIAVVEDEKGNIIFERELPVRNGKLIVDIYYGERTPSIKHYLIVKNGKIGIKIKL